MQQIQKTTAHHKQNDWEKCDFYEAKVILGYKRGKTNAAVTKNKKRE